MLVEARTGISYSSHQPNAAEAAVTRFGHDKGPWETCLLQGYSCPGQGLLASLNLDISQLRRNTLL